MMEIYKRLTPTMPYTIWVGKDAEGRKGYTISLDALDGTATEPSSVQYYSLRALQASIGIKKWPHSEQE